MREIEFAEWMRHSLLITGIDKAKDKKWSKLKPEEQERLTELNMGKEWCEEQGSKNIEPQYASPSSKFYHKAIFWSLGTVWGLMVLSAWFLPQILPI